MFLHLGEDYTINEKEIVGIFDLDTATVSPATRALLKTAEEEGRVVTVTDALPKSFTVCRGFYGERIFLSGLNAATLKKRITGDL